MLDLHEELGALGYVSPLDGLSFEELRAQDGAGRMLASFRVFGGKREREEPRTEKRREQKRASARAAYERERANDPGRRRYVRHPPGTPRHRMGDPEKRAERARRYAREARAAAKAARLEAKRMNDARREGFVNALIAHDLEGAARMVCAGRFVYDDANNPDANNPDFRALFDGSDPHEVAARVDFCVYLRHPLRAWTRAAIADLFDVPEKRVEKWLGTRSKYAGEDLDGA